MLRLFHSYQYIPNSKEIFFDKEAKQLKTSDGSFLLGLLQIPDIPNYELIVEKYLVSKRQSKKVNYRNHTKHNMKIFINITETDLDDFISNVLPKLDINYKITQTQYILNILKKNYLQFTLDHNLFDIICVTPQRKNPFINSLKKITLFFSKQINIGKYNYNLDKNSFCLKNKKDDTEKINLKLDGGILLGNPFNNEKDRIVKFLEYYKSDNLVIVFEEQYEMKLWSHILKSKNIDIVENKIIEVEGKTVFTLKSFNNIINKKSKILYFPNQSFINIDFFKKVKLKLNLNLETFWLFVTDKDCITINFLSKFVCALGNLNLKNLDFETKFIPDSFNIYQLSKVIVPISKPFEKSLIKTKTLQLDKSLMNIFKVNMIELNNDDLPSNTTCSICLQSNLTFMKTNCEHIFCLNCYINSLSIKIKENTNIECCLCRQNLLSKKITLFKDTEKIELFSNLINFLKKCLYSGKQIIHLGNKNITENINFINIINYFKDSMFNKKINLKIIENIDELITFSIDSKIDFENYLILHLDNIETSSIKKILNIGFNSIYHIRFN